MTALVKLRRSIGHIDQRRLWAGRVFKNNHDASLSTLAKGSGTNFFDMEHGNWNRDDSFNVMQDFLSKHDQIDAA